MNQAVQGCYDFRWSDIISGKNILHLWGIVILLLGIIAVSPGSSIAANSLDVMDRQRDQKRPVPLSQPKNFMGLLYLDLSCILWKKLV